MMMVSPIAIRTSSIPSATPLNSWLSRSESSIVPPPLQRFELHGVFRPRVRDLFALLRGDDLEQVIRILDLGARLGPAAVGVLDALVVPVPPGGLVRLQAVEGVPLEGDDHLLRVHALGPADPR